MASKEEKIAYDMQKELDDFLNESSESIESDDIELIPTGIKLLDAHLGGGIGKGIFVQLVGYPGSFKSTIGIQIAKSFRDHDPNTSILYVDTENSMTKERLDDIGLSRISLRYNYTIETLFNEIFKICELKKEKNITDTPTVIIWDSIANTNSDADSKSLDVNQTIGQKAKLLSQKLPSILNNIRKSNITIVAINQLRTSISIGPFSNNTPDLKHLGADDTIPGGRSISYNSSQLLECKVKTSYDEEKNPSPYGFRTSIIKIKTVKNKFFPDNYTFEYIVDVAHGIDDLYTSFEMLKKFKKINAGAWNYFPELSDVKFRQNKLRDTYLSNPEFKKLFDSSIDQVLNELTSKMKKQQIIQSDESEESEPKESTVDDIFAEAQE
jgi:RecA/RadA recombinase